MRFYKFQEDVYFQEMTPQHYVIAILMAHFSIESNFSTFTIFHNEIDLTDTPLATGFISPHNRPALVNNVDLEYQTRYFLTLQRRQFILELNFFVTNPILSNDIFQVVYE